jgi:hypothetical protein
MEQQSKPGEVFKWVEKDEEVKEQFDKLESEVIESTTRTFESIDNAIDQFENLEYKDQLFFKMMELFGSVAKSYRAKDKVSFSGSYTPEGMWWSITVTSTPQDPRAKDTAFKAKLSKDRSSQFISTFAPDDKSKNVIFDIETLKIYYKSKNQAIINDIVWLFGCHRINQLPVPLNEFLQQLQNFNNDYEGALVDKNACLAKFTDFQKLIFGENSWSNNLLTWGIDLDISRSLSEQLQVDILNNQEFSNELFGMGYGFIFTQANVQIATEKQTYYFESAKLSYRVIEGEETLFLKVPKTNTDPIEYTTYTKVGDKFLLISKGWSSPLDFDPNLPKSFLTKDLNIIWNGSPNKDFDEYLNSELIPKQREIYWSTNEMDSQVYYIDAIKTLFTNCENNDCYSLLGTPTEVWLDTFFSALWKDNQIWWKAYVMLHGILSKNNDLYAQLSAMFYNGIGEDVNYKVELMQYDNKITQVEKQIFNMLKNHQVAFNSYLKLLDSSGSERIQMIKDSKIETIKIGLIEQFTWYINKNKWNWIEWLERELEEKRLWGN